MLLGVHLSDAARTPGSAARPRRTAISSAAMLMAIVVPAVVFATPGTLAFSYTNPKVVAALAAALVAWRTRSAVATMTLGMLTLWTAQWLR